MDMNTMQVLPAQGEREREIIVEGELEYVTAAIDDLVLSWYLDKNRAVVLLPRMGYQKDKTRPWWPVYDRDGPDNSALMGGVHARGMPHAQTRLVFELGGFPDPNLFWETAAELIEEMKRRGFAPQPQLARDEAGKMGIFFAYAHEDEKLRDELEKHLSTLRRQGVITSWHDRKIGGGKQWNGEIDMHLDTAHMILLLISADFIDSDYCWDVEVKRAMERHKAGEARVIPVILRPVEWRDAPFGKLQALPTDAKPVTSWENRDEAFLDIAQGIRAAVMELRAEDNRAT